MPKRKKEPSTLGTIVKSAYKGYRKIADPVLPAVRRVIDPLSLLVAGNVTLAELVYYGTPKAQKALEYALNRLHGQETYDHLSSFVQQHPNVGTGGKVAAYAALFGGLNYLLGPRALKLLKGKKIAPDYLKKIFGERSLPKGFHHARILATAAAAIALWNYTDVGKDAKRLGGKYWNLASETARTFEEYMSGRKTHKIIGDISDLFDIEAYRVPEKESKELEKGLKKAEERKPEYSYLDKVSDDARRLSRIGIVTTPEQLAYKARVVYFEGAKDERAKNDVELMRGMHAIAHVMKNRWEYEKLNHEGRFSPKNSDKFFDVVFYHPWRTRIGKEGKKVNYTLWEFTCIKDQKEYFEPHEGKKNWDIYEGGKINVAVGGMSRKKAEMAYQALMDVLEGKSQDPTNGSLYYQNPKYADKYNRDWDRKLKRETQINSHVFYKLKKRNATESRATYREDSNSQKYGIPKSQRPMLAYAANNAMGKRMFQRKTG